MESRTRRGLVGPTLAAVLPLVLTQPQVAAQPNGPTPPAAIDLPLAAWTVGGGALRMSPRDGGVRLAVPGTADWGNCYIEGQVSVDEFPFLVVWIVEVGRDAKWQLSVNDPEARVLQGGAETVGLHVYDLRQTPGWRGLKRFRVYLTVLGRGKHVDVGWASLCRQPPMAPADDAHAVPVLKWQRLNNQLATADDRGLRLSLARDVGLWGGASARVTVDTDRFPFVEADVRRLSPESRWRISIEAKTTGPEDRNAGVVAFNYGAAHGWHGPRDIEIQLILLGTDSTAELADVRLAAFPSASTDLVRRAALPAGREVRDDWTLSTGAYRLIYDRAVGAFRLQRDDGRACLLTRFLEMPRVDLGDPNGLDGQRGDGAEGQRLSLRRVAAGAQFTVACETFADAPGLLHWRVVATPQMPITLPSSGHEICYCPPPTEPGLGLQPIASQNMSATPVAFAVAPGVGTVLYWQNLTALNPIFELCRTSPRWRASAGPFTLGFANPLDAQVRAAPGTDYLLADTWLYVVPAEPAAPEEQAALFLQALATIYDRLPDKPETEFLDWPRLARLSLQDLHRPQCWGAFAGKEYLQPYVNTAGAVAQLAPLHDVWPPLLRFQQETGAGEDITSKLRALLPDFWSENRGTFLQYAPPGDHIWWDTMAHVNLCRAALAGEAQAKELCLRSVGPLVELAHRTGYTFQGEGLETLTNQRAGEYLLFLMLCHELAGEGSLVEEARRAAEHLRTWRFPDNRACLICSRAMTCEGLARLYAATGDEQYVRDSLVPLAALVRNAWLWECDYGFARRYPTFFGLNGDELGVDYIAAMEQHLAWHSLREYCLAAGEALPPAARCLASEFLRYAPTTIWYAYPPHLPAEALHQGEAFWKTTNINEAYIPLEDLNHGWIANGSVGQELYGAGAAFDVAAEAYTKVPVAGVTVFCEYPVRQAEWDKAARALMLSIGGVAHHRAKLELRYDAGLSGWDRPEDVRVRWAHAGGDALQLAEVTTAGGALRTSVPGACVVTVSPG